jgi:hypothetical protein
VSQNIETINTNNQVKSKKRVADHGEVFTNEREVNAMLDLVKQETERIDSRFLEPACGNGNFLAEVLKRKLDVVEQRYGKSQIEWERYSVIAVSSIYGVDILEDNAKECRERLLGIYIEYYSKHFKNTKPNCIRAVNYIIHRNILHGNALDLINPDSKKPIIFSEWSAVNGNLIQRRDFELDKLLKPRNAVANSLFSDLGDEAFIPEPIEVFPIIDFMNLGEDDTNEL